MPKRRINLTFQCRARANYVGLSPWKTIASTTIEVKKWLYLDYFKLIYHISCAKVCKWKPLAISVFITFWLPVRFGLCTILSVIILEKSRVKQRRFPHWKMTPTIYIYLCHHQYQTLYSDVSYIYWSKFVKCYQVRKYFAEFVIYKYILST
jgi:hypothetical protein